MLVHQRVFMTPLFTRLNVANPMPKTIAKSSPCWLVVCKLSLSGSCGIGLPSLLGLFEYIQLLLIYRETIIDIQFCFSILFLRVGKTSLLYVSFMSHYIQHFQCNWFTFIDLYTYLYIYISIYRSITIYLSIDRSIYLSIDLSTSMYLYIYIYIYTVTTINLALYHHFDITSCLFRFLVPIIDFLYPVSYHSHF